MGGKKQKSTQKTILPDYIKQGSKDAVGRATDILNRDYQAYGGDRVAGLSQNEQMASELARQNIGLSQGYLGQGADALGRVQTFDQANMGAYMNPYIENVLNVGQRKINEGFGRKEAELARTSGMTSAFGGGRQTQLESDLSANQLETSGDFWAEGMGGAFDAATGLWGRDQDRAIAQAGAYQGLAGASSQATGADIRNLAGTGLVERSVDQAGKDFDYAEFIEGRDWDVNNLGPLLETLKTVPYETTQTSESKTSSSPLGTIAGAAMTVGGFMATGGMTGALDLLKTGTSLLGGAEKPGSMMDETMGI